MPGSRRSAHLARALRGAPGAAAGCARAWARRSGEADPGGVRSALGSARKLVKQGGEWVAIAHKVPKTGFKADNAYGAKPPFSGMTTNKSFQRSVRTVGSQQGPTSKKLMPYYPNASRNRPKETMENTPGQRFGFKASASRHEAYRGSSQVKFADGDPRSNRRWKTTNQVFSECAMVTNTIGLNNQGISADVARAMHEKQNN